MNFRYSMATLLSVLAFAAPVKSMAADVGYLVPVQGFMSVCDGVVREAVARVAGPEMLEAINYYKAGKTALPQYHSCCGIENWPVFSAKDYSSENVTFGELTIVPSNPSEGSTSATVRLNRDKSATFVVMIYAQARIPESQVGFSYEVTTRLRARPSSVGWMVRFSSPNPSKQECLSKMTMTGYMTGR